MKKYIRFIKKIIRIILPSEGLINYFWHLPIEWLYAVRYGFPGRKITVIGVAGTKGKTTTAYFIAQLLESIGKRVALYSTAAVKIAGKEELNTEKMTTPGRGFMQRLLLRAVRAQCEYAILEISSHGLKQFRLIGIPFPVVIFTNMMPDHLDYHKTDRDYTFSHQRMIGPKTKVVAINGEDAQLRKLRITGTHTIIFGKGDGCDMRINNVEGESGGTSFTLSYLSKTIPLYIRTLGIFNVYNATAALAALRGIGVDILELRENIKALIPAPGRMESIPNEYGYTVIVDYAHSPDSFDQVLKTMKPQTKGNLIAVTGACGDRDARVRPVMGKLLGQYCDYVVLTNDDPYTEDPEKIIQELHEGIRTVLTMKEEKSYWIIMDRRSAITKGLSLAKSGDIVMILGKGAEQWQGFKDKRIPWDDREVARELLNEKKSGTLQK
ncbi:MAG: UDP-N-acetylmuramoylalanyl-D-glutamate-2,6-diaminopimelate ligase, UDP-N-acetylmuramoyl-L-alanyl-D-glutamate-2,6-diaminopimelate ligase [Parcubacteria group bacterium GW2011_GWC1_43_12]|nr:MAG: UDP-N-acetylmuramoylalanyl-D-glutamate-2,6-diaminopimelate ligase, UDP-N-acetylmuramoyl-L-alanyl-D-glutamate-2,6-diaminopimelate ligase [Parcubacteria group bacterium GW2011_GWC1_43_12]